MMYMEGAYPVYQEVPVADPVFPDFLLHAASNDEADSDESNDEYKAPRYAVTRKPLTFPLPTGHPNFQPGKPKYDGRFKDPNYRKKLEESEESDEEEEEEEDEVHEPEPQTEDQVHEALLRDKQERNKKDSEVKNEH